MKKRYLVLLAIAACVVAVLAQTDDPAVSASSDLVYLSSKVPGVSLPPCTPVRLLPGPGEKNLTVEAVRGPSDRFAVKPSRVEKTERFADFTECVEAAPEYAGRYVEGDPELYASGTIAVGMPVEFLTMWLGAHSKKQNTAVGREYTWLELTAGDAEQPQARSFGVAFLPLAKLDEARSVKALATADRRIERLTVVIAPRALDDLDWRELQQDSAKLTAFREALAAYDRGDRVEALKAWRILAEGGYAPAQYSLGDMYYRGDGVELNLTEAAEWIRKAAMQYYLPALYQYGFLNARGEGVPQDLKEAYYWVEVASLLGDQNAQTAREVLTPGLTRREIEEVERRIRTDIRSPELLLHVEPVYPELARVARLEGKVILQGVITKEGFVRDVEVLRCNRRNMGFEQAAVDAVRFWRYKPAEASGKPVAVYFSVFVEFNLHPIRPG